MKKRLIKFLTAKYDTTRSRTLRLERSLKGRKGGQMLFAFKLFAGRIMEDIVEFVIVVFADPSESFIILKKRDEEAVCRVSYVEYRLYSRKLKLLSLGGGSTVVLATLMISFVVAFISPNLDVF